MDKKAGHSSQNVGVPVARIILGRNLRALMEHNSYNQVELAKRSGVSQRHILLDYLAGR